MLNTQRGKIKEDSYEIEVERTELIMLRTIPKRMFEEYV
jgi:hypothetical protein